MKKEYSTENIMEMTATGILNGRAQKIETTIRFFIKKKPWYLTDSVWTWLLNQLVDVSVADKWL